jgi:hypothetical protein
VKLNVVDVIFEENMIGIVVEIDGKYMAASTSFGSGCVVPTEEILSKLRQQVMAVIEQKLFNDYNVRSVTIH